MREHNLLGKDEFLALTNLFLCVEYELGNGELRATERPVHRSPVRTRSVTRGEGNAARTATVVDDDGNSVQITIEIVPPGSSSESSSGSSSGESDYDDLN